MSVVRLLTIAEMQGRELLRRRLALAILVALPLGFYFSMLGNEDFAMSAGSIGMGWAVSGAALFSALAARRLDPRLVLTGYRPVELLGGRLLVLQALALVLVGGFSALIVTLSEPAQPTALVLGIALTAFVGVPLGLAVAALLPRELEGTMLLVGVVGIELSLPGDATAAPFLPLYGPLHLAGVAAGASEAIAPLVLHSLGFAAGLFLLAAALWSARIRVGRG